MTKQIRHRFFQPLKRLSLSFSSIRRHPGSARWLQRDYSGSTPQPRRSGSLLYACGGFVLGGLFTVATFSPALRGRVTDQQGSRWSIPSSTTVVTRRRYADMKDMLKVLVTI